MKNQEIANHCLAQSEELNRLLATGHFGKDGSETYMLAAGSASAHKETGQLVCEHKITVDAAGVGTMCKVCGKTLEEGERGD